MSTQKEQIEKLVALSHKYGADPRCVIAGGGNTSFKSDGVLWVKASGHALATITEEGFVRMDLAKLAAMRTKQYSNETATRERQVKEDLGQACLTSGLRPSVEASLHALLPWRYVVHLHPTLVNGLMCSVGAESVCRRLFPDALYVEYTDPGYTLFKKVMERAEAFEARKGQMPKIIFLQNHGVFVGADSSEEIENIYDEIFDRIKKEELGIRDDNRETELVEICSLVPAVRQMLSRCGRGLKTVKVNRSAVALEFASSWENFTEVATPFTPDEIVYCKSEYLYIGADGIEAKLAEADQKIEDFVARRGYTPKVLLIKGVGVLAVGSNARESETIHDVFEDAMFVALHARAFGGPHGMDRASIAFIDNWEVENYRRSVAADGQVQSPLSRLRMTGKTVIVTGAAQGFGEGIARLLLVEGANIVVADINEAVGRETAASFNRQAAVGNRSMFVKTNVADLASVRALVEATVLAFGAVDVFISNAGVLRAGSLDDLTPEQFDFVTSINYKGYFNCAKAVSPVMKAAAACDEAYFADIIQVNSKSGLRGSKANYAYAGSKFGGVGLTQSFALELAPFRIKVNSICPGNYYDGPLWSDPENGLFVQYLRAGKVPGAASVEDVRRYYLAQVPMRKGCTPEDVTKAILYAIEQTGETGQAIPVTGGQVMLS